MSAGPAPGGHDAAQSALGNQPSFEERVRAIVDAGQAETWTSLPAIVEKKSADGHTVTLKSALKIPRREEDGTIAYDELPVFIDVPINFSGGGEFTNTFPLDEGDEGWIEVSARGHGNWRQNGGVQQPQDLRTHALSNVRFRPGARSDPRKLKGVSTKSAQTRTDDKQSVHDVSHTAITAVREGAAHQVNGKAVQTELAGTRHVVDASGIQAVGGKFFWNC